MHIVDANIYIDKYPTILVHYINIYGDEQMKTLLALFAKLFSGWFCNSACKTKLDQNEREKIIKLSKNVDMDEY